jgi:hypothetical protein
VEAVAYFCRYVAGPKIEELTGGSWDVLQDEMTHAERKERAEERQTMADEWLCKAEFEEFLTEFKKTKTWPGIHDLG